jgi:23S rRNA (guanosine2251-2'-O)-methyltransferase
MIISGIHSVSRVLTIYGKEATSLSLGENLSTDIRQKFSDTAKKLSIPLHKAGEKELLKLAGTDRHGDCVLTIKDGFLIKPFKGWYESFKVTEKTCVVICDELQDPYNVGAIMRTAVAVGAHAIIIPDHRQVSMTQSVLRASAGSFCDIDIVNVPNVNHAIRSLQEKDFWIFGLDMEGDTNLFDLEVTNRPSAIVIGSEHEGIHKHTKELCDEIISIPLSEKLDSLNASVSASLMLYEWKRKSGK